MIAGTKLALAELGKLKPPTTVVVPKELAPPEPTDGTAPKVCVCAYACVRAVVLCVIRW
jgi:hypothetical protein